MGVLSNMTFKKYTQYGTTFHNFPQTSQLIDWIGLRLNSLFTRLKSLAWSQQGFWLLSFCRNCSLWSVCCYGGTRLMLCCFDCRDEIVDQPNPQSFSTLSHSSKQAMQNTPTLDPPSQQRVHKLQFQQELSCQKPWWDQARLSSLVNKQVAWWPIQWKHHRSDPCTESLDRPPPTQVLNGETRKWPKIGPLSLAMIYDKPWFRFMAPFPI